MPPHILRTIVIGTAIVVFGLTAGNIIMHTREAPMDTGGGSASSEASAFSASSSSSSPCSAASSESSLSSTDGSSASSSAPDIDPCLGIAMEELWQQTSSAIPDPTKPPFKNILADPRLEPYFPLRITQTLSDGVTATYDYEDPYTYQQSFFNTPRELFVNGKSFFFAEGMGWAIRHPGDYGYIEDPTLMLSTILAIGLFPQINPDLGFVSTGQEPCKTAQGKTCNTFLQSRTGMTVWIDTNTQLLDYWDMTDGAFLGVAYNASIVPILEPATYVDFRSMMPPGMPTLP